MYGLVVFLHVVGAFAFVLAHGISMLVSFRLRSERDRARQAHLLELSSIGVGLTYIGLVLLLVAGIAAGFLGDTGAGSGSGRPSARWRSSSSSCTRSRRPSTGA